MKEEKTLYKQGGCAAFFHIHIVVPLYIQHHSTSLLIMIIIISSIVNRFVENGGRCGEKAGTDLL